VIRAPGIPCAAPGSGRVQAAAVPAEEGEAVDVGRRRRQQAGAHRVGAVLALAALAALAGGCAQLGLAAGPEPALVERVPEDAPPELDFLVGRELELDGEAEQALRLYARAIAKDPDSVYLLRHAAELSAREGRLTDALVYAERALELEPDDEGVRLFLGTLYRFRRDTDAARRVLTTGPGEPINRDAAVLLYGILSDAKRLGEAKDVAAWLVDEEPEGLRGYLALADAFEKMGDPAAAEATLRRGLGVREGDLALYGALARARRARGDRVGEIEIYDEVLARQPDHHPSLLARAEAELALGRSDAAVATLERVIELHPDDLRSLLRLAFLRYERDEFAPAARLFEQALETQPEQHEVAYFLGVVRRRLGDEEGALRAFERIPPDHERYADARTQIAGVHERRDEFEAAIAEVERARAIEPGRPLDLYLASLRAKSGDAEGAIAFLESLLEESPDDAEVLYNIGVIHGEASNVDEAIRYMKIVLGIDPDHAGALNYVGYTWAEQGTNLDQAEQMISRALELRPEDGYITDSLGWVYYMRARPLIEAGQIEKGRFWADRAIAELRRAAELTGGDPVIAEHLGDAYLLVGEKEQALQMYEEALRQGPRGEAQPDLRDKVLRLRQELGRR
jgi:tetratricopeptide (TPR) repeat protein